MRIGVDLGGTKIEAIALGPGGREMLRRRVPTPGGDYAGILRAVAALVAGLERDLGERGSVGIGTPGSISRVTGRMKNCNSTVLNGRPFAQDLGRMLGREVRIANDADCFALSEASDGAAAAAATVFGVILGTGVGGGLVVGGRLLAGPNGICGEWGHNPAPSPAAPDYRPRVCYCGRLDCIETWLSGTGFASSYAQASGQHLSAREVAQLVIAGDAIATQCYRRYADLLARALAAVVNIFDPHVVVLGGGMSNMPALCDDVAARWGAYIFSDRVDTQLVRARHGDSSGVRGAAWLWPPAL